MPRLTQIKEEVSEIKIDEKAMIISEDIYVSVTRDGYIKTYFTKINESKYEYSIW